MLHHAMNLRSGWVVARLVEWPILITRGPRFNSGHWQLSLWTRTPTVLSPKRRKLRKEELRNFLKLTSLFAMMKFAMFRFETRSTSYGGEPEASFLWKIATSRPTVRTLVKRCRLSPDISTDDLSSTRCSSPRILQWTAWKGMCLKLSGSWNISSSLTTSKFPKSMNLTTSGPTSSTVK